MNIGPYSIPQILIGVVIVIACVALLHVALVVFGVGIPDWICVAAFIVIAAIGLVSSMRTKLRVVRANGQGVDQWIVVWAPEN